MTGYLEDHGLPLVQLKERRRDLVVAQMGRRSRPVPKEQVAEIAAIQNRALKEVFGPASAATATHEIGAIESTGEHKGEIYGGIYPADNKPIWFSAAPKLMDHYAAAAWAKEQGGSLPTRAQGDNAV